jgi:ribonuclease HII
MHAHHTQLLIGIDEVGLGAVYGPLCMGAVTRLDDVRIDGVRDSKKVTSEPRRNQLAQQIRDAHPWQVAMLPAEAINRYGRNACLQRLVTHLIQTMAQLLMDQGYRNFDFLMDGDQLPVTDMQVGDAKLHIRCEPKADANFYEVSAASLVAKVHRDNWVHRAVEQTPALAQYQLDANKGYGSSAHAAAIDKHGLTPDHRVAYCKSLLKTYRTKGAANLPQALAAQFQT